MKNELTINENWKLWIIDFIDYIKDNLFHENYKTELNGLRSKYIFKDISENIFLTDLKRLKQIKEVCEYRTQFFYN
jgi:hypothetical protein